MARKIVSIPDSFSQGGLNRSNSTGLKSLSPIHINAHITINIKGNSPTPEQLNKRYLKQCIVIFIAGLSITGVSLIFLVIILAAKREL